MAEPTSRTNATSRTSWPSRSLASTDTHRRREGGGGEGLHTRTQTHKHTHAMTSTFGQRIYISRPPVLADNRPSSTSDPNCGCGSLGPTKWRIKRCGSVTLERPDPRPDPPLVHTLDGPAHCPSATLRESYPTRVKCHPTGREWGNQAEEVNSRPPLPQRIGQERGT